MAGIYKPKRVMEANDIGFGVCVWMLPDGSKLQNTTGDYLNSAGKIGDPVCEYKITAAARSLGYTEGKPLWLPGFRRITNSEWEDQMERLLEGKIPDPVDVWRQNSGLDS